MNASKTNIAVFGLGFVGLTTAVGFAKHNFKVVGYEIDSKKEKMLNELKIPFFEKDLQQNLESTLNKSLTITNNIRQAVESSDIIFYCIGTPMGEDGSANLDYLLQALKSTCEIIKNSGESKILVIKSTIPPSTCKSVFIPFVESMGFCVNEHKDSNKPHIYLANNPEFLREGFALSDFLNPDRIVVGCDNSEFVKEKMSEIYKPFNSPLQFVNLNSGEFIKYLSNCLLATNISYANQMSLIAQSIGDIDIKNAFKILHLDKRLRHSDGSVAGIASYIYPGLGFGGYCLPKDTLALYKKARDFSFNASLLKNVLEVNDEVLDFYVNLISNNEQKSSKIGILGLSFKPESDDVRDSKAASLIAKLLDKGFKNLYAYDCMANEIFRQTYNYNITYLDSLENIMQECEILVIATGWEEFKKALESKNKKIYNLRYI